MICIPIGTRPTIIKISPIVRELQKREIDFFLVHTGQHYSYELNKIFFEQLKLPEPKYNLEIGSLSQSEQIGKAMIGLEKVFKKEKPDLILIHGDANMVPAASLAGTRLGLKTIHKEAGLRSYNEKMPEETNRVMADHICNFLFTPTENSKNNLIKEGISKEKIFVTGNTIVDAVNYNIKIVEDLKIDVPKDFILLTLHRAENVDNKLILNSILDGINLIAKENKIIFPIHPRTKKRIEEFNLQSKLENINLIEPLGYFEFLKYLSSCKLVMTDSGGIQEEACTLKIPCITLRTETERSESVSVGANIVAGVNDPQKILNSVNEMLNKERNWDNPFGDGKAAERIVDLMEKL